MPRNGRELQHRQLWQICHFQMVKRCEEFFDTSCRVLHPRIPKPSEAHLNLTLFFIAWKLKDWKWDEIGRGSNGGAQIYKNHHVSRLSRKFPAWSQKIHQQHGPPDLTSTCHLRHKKSGNLSPPEKKYRTNSHKDILAAIYRRILVAVFFLRLFVGPAVWNAMSSDAAEWWDTKKETF